MNSEVNIRSMVQRHSAIPIERLRVTDRLEDLRLSHIRLGIVFILAAWSGPAIVGLRKVTGGIAEHVIDSLDIVVIDFDCLSHHAFEVLFGSNGFPVGGNGETLWVRDGVVVAREDAASCTDRTILEHTLRLQNSQNA